MSTRTEFSMVNSFGLLFIAVSSSSFGECVPASVVRAGRARIGHRTVRVGQSSPGQCADRARPARLARPDGGRPAGQDAVELVARADVELGEDLAQVVLDRARTDEQPGADFRVREAVAGEPGDLSLLSGQLVPGLDGALADFLASGQELAPGPIGERLHAHRRQHLVGGAQLLAGVYAAALAAQPLAIEQVGAGELHADAGTPEARDRLAVEALGDVTLVEQGADAGFDSQRPLGGGYPRAFGQPLECSPDERHVAGPGRRF